MSSRIVRTILGLYRQEGALQSGNGKVSGIIAYGLGCLSLLAVAAFHFPEYLTTPELRHKYSVDTLRAVLLGTMLIAGGIALGNVLLNRRRALNAGALLVVLVAAALGGPFVPVHEFADNTPYLALDWFVLDLLKSTVVFIAIERLMPMYPQQPTFRPGWQTDFKHFAVNHLLLGLALLIVNSLVHSLFHWAAFPGLQAWIHALPFVLGVFLAVLAADLVQYATHRAYHEVPLLWRIHAVHHSTPHLDWLAGSRLHFIELIATRVSVLGTLYVLGFPENVLNTYIVIIGVQGVVNHSNFRMPFEKWLAPILVTPSFHHWHHSSDRVALDRNYAAHFSFIDRLFGTAVKTDRPLPESYGVLGDYMPEGYFPQQAFPFTYKGKT